MATGFYWDERCFWHSGGNFAFLLPVGGLVQPAIAGGLPENPETKRRLKNLMEVTGLLRELDCRGAEPVTEADLLRVHTSDYVDAFRAAAAEGGGELGLRAPFGPDGFDTARGRVENAYALSRPPGHHCLPDFPNGFCLLNNIAIAVEAALDADLTERVAVLDWDVHHGNGTEAIFYDRDDVLTISLHQERNYPYDTGGPEMRGTGAGEGCNVNVALPPGGGHACYLEAMERIVLPALSTFEPDMIVVACGFDASGVDPLGRMMARSDTFRAMTEMTMEAAGTLCDGRLVLVHEGGYSEAHVPFCGHAVIETLSGSAIRAADPLDHRIRGQQPGPRFDAFCSALIGEMAADLGY
jgi:acetoin utilization deacetylase AcuC-like enzyme